MCVLPHEVCLYHKLVRYVIIIDNLASGGLLKPSRSHIYARHLF